MDGQVDGFEQDRILSVVVLDVLIENVPFSIYTQETSKDVYACELTFGVSCEFWMIVFKQF